ncbi:MAG: hypothetical protein EXR09_11515 [Acetobacteraceae bacterium]|nr:hypothetical protein [Acetobacteraceae bacterium]
MSVGRIAVMLGWCERLLPMRGTPQRQDGGRMQSFVVPYMARLIPALVGVALISLLAACASGPGTRTARDVNYYRGHARSDYTPPGPAHDPWGPYITQAANRFDVPDVWIREVMRAESGGNLFRRGELITSGAGAMGLMQVMPGTYEELRERHALDDDPFDPKNNILAGTAYIREMYDIYGAPGFLAAYNAGPKRLDDYLANQRDLPTETRRYVAKIGPNILDTHPNLWSQATQYAMNAMPVNVPPGLRYGRSGRGQPIQMAQAQMGQARVPSETPIQGNALGGQRTVQVAQLAPPAAPARGRVSLAAAPSASQQPPANGGYRLIPSAVAAPVTPSGPMHGGSGQWAIQLGAFSSESQARMATGSAIAKVSETLGSANPQISGVRQRQVTLYRARLVGLSQAAAMQACQRLQRGGSTCVVVSPDARS